MNRLRAAAKRPGHAIQVLVWLGKGWLCRASAAIRGVDFKAGPNLRVQGRLVLNGPGRVRFGANVTVGMRVTPWTHSPDAEIRVGDGCFLNGTSLGCAQSIVIGPRCILADARIMDTNFHSVHTNRHDEHAPVRVAQVQIGENVWIGAASGILPGTSIGENSVVGFGSVCSGHFPANSLIAGNPARVVREIGPSDSVPPN